MIYLARSVVTQLRGKLFIQTKTKDVTPVPHLIIANSTNFTSRNKEMKLTSRTSKGWRYVLTDRESTVDDNEHSLQN